ncbi:MAG TPA: proprotein convertase P-domain-containing protein, partial [Rhodanobacteraceae bacterium]|nr:proprotein convertase P-domain-containing protein [Rhodanobacteraceae bacterium]
MIEPASRATRQVARRAIVVLGGFLAALALRSAAAMPPLDCSTPPGAVVHDDGTYEIAYGGYWEDVSSMRFVDKFTPSFYPATYSSVCVSISKQEVGGTLDGFDFSVIAYADDGPDGAPGTSLGSVPVHVDMLPDYVFGAAGEFAMVDISSLALDIASGSVYLGAEWDPTQYVGIFIWMDTDSSGGPPSGGYESLNGNPWDSLFFMFPDYTSLLIRAIERSPVPRLAIDAGAIAIADACAANPAASNGVVEPGETVDVAVPVFATTGDFTNVHAALALPAPPGVTYLDSDAALGDLVDGARATAHLRIRMDPKFACMTSFELPLSLTADQGTFAAAPTIGVGERASDVVPHGLPLKTDVTGTTSVIHVPQSATLADLSVHVNIRHYSIGSLGFTLTSPAGTTIWLLDRPGYPPFPGCENADVDVTFTDGAPDPEHICAEPPGGTPWPVSVAGPTEPFATFGGENLQGDWTLTVYDYWSDSIGAIIDWSLAPTPALADVCEVCAGAPDRIFENG